MPPSHKSPVTQRKASSAPTLIKAKSRFTRSSESSLGLSDTSTARQSRSIESRQQSLDLPVKSDFPARADASAKSDQLWLCIHFPKLPLQSLRWERAGDARAVFEERKGVRCVLQANTAAAAAGVHPGMAVNAALSLLPALSLKERDRDGELRLMSRMASWAERFTSFVVLEPRGILLLEIAGSQRLFAGLGAIRHQVSKGLDERGLTASVAVAPTPLASTWLAKSNTAVCIEDVGHIAGQLSRLPLTFLEWPERVTDALAGVGASCIGDCLRLPRSGFARRFGTFYLQQIDRALGRLPDPRTHHRSPQSFCADYELDEEQDDCELLLAACQTLLHQFERFLRHRQMRVLRIKFSFFHLREAATHLTLGRMQAGQDIAHWLELLRIKLERIELPAAVIAVRLQSGRGQSSTFATDDLRFTESARARDTSVACLLERFRARLGDASVHGVDVTAEHRPQRAWRTVRLLEETLGGGVPAPPDGVWASQTTEGVPCLRRLSLYRPLWVLDVPERLVVDGDSPMYRGAALIVLDGPERLESGWWDEHSIARDYFVAEAEGGVYLWVYRDRQRLNAAWYLHGFFA